MRHGGPVVPEGSRRKNLSLGALEVLAQVDSPSDGVGLCQAEMSNSPRAPFLCGRIHSV